MQGGRGVKIVIFMALRCKVMENTRKTEGAWGKSFSGPPRGPEEQRTYEQRTRLQRAGLWIASTRVEKYNDWAVSARCKHQGMSWSPQGVLALAALEAARRNGELDAWRRDGALPERALPEPVRKAA